MELEQRINNDIKQAMLAKDKVRLESLRAMKSGALLLKTSPEAKDGEVSEAQIVKALQKMVKQRKESAEIFMGQGRQDLAEAELRQAEVIAGYLPQQLSEAEVEQAVRKIIAEAGATSLRDMGKVMGLAAKALAGKADNKLVSEVVKRTLQ